MMHLPIVTRRRDLWRASGGSSAGRRRERVRIPKRATEKQLAYIGQLMQEREATAEIEILWTRASRPYRPSQYEPFRANEASELIDMLKAAPRKK